MTRLIPLLAALALAPAAAYAGDPKLELSESTLNKVLTGLGTFSDGGTATPYNVHEHDPLIDVTDPHRPR